MNPAFIDPSSIVVTGIGLATPLGADRESSWQALVSGRSALAHDPARVPLAENSVPRPIQLALAAAQEALAGFPGRDLGEDWGCVVSSSKPFFARPGFTGGGLSAGWVGPSLGQDALALPDALPRAVASDWGIRGPVMNVASACATGLQSVMVAAEWIREGRCSRALAGASESSLHPLFLSGFAQMGVLTGKNQVRPFDRSRDGFIIGEGAAVFLLETAASARARQAPVYGVLRGWDFSCDAHHPTRFNSSGRRIADSLARALSRAGVSAKSVDYVNAHGTATPLNDHLEILALRQVFGKGSAAAVSSTKAATGHLLGAAGAVELAFCLLALRDGLLPPTLNLQDPETHEIDLIAEHTRPCAAQVAATLSFGFGGALGSLVMEK